MTCLAEIPPFLAQFYLLAGLIKNCYETKRAPTAKNVIKIWHYVCSVQKPA
jgi:hypothetical protein